MEKKGRFYMIYTKERLQMITITLKDGVQKQFDTDVTIVDIAKSISEGLARVAVAGTVDGKVSDLRTVVDRDANINILTFDSDEGKRVFRHTASHILAQAVKRLHKGAKLAIGPAIEDGFYYDIDNDIAFTSEQLVEIEKEMKKIVKEALDIEVFTLPRTAAIKLMEEHNEPYKVELIQELPDGEVVSFYRQGEFVDLCAGPHLMNTKYVKALKIFSEAGSSGAYWRGDEKNKMLGRIYGTAFIKNADLEAHIKQKEEAKKRDHNKLGRELKFFTTSDVIGQGLPLLMPKGSKVIQLLQRFVEDEEERRGYLLTKTPLMGKSDLYKVSGHWQHYRDGMFIIGDEEKDSEVLALRPMTCPFQFGVYLAEQHSYRDLPLRYGETSTLFRNESSGEMHGLIRVRQFTISEGHIVCREDQVVNEFKEVLNLVNYMMQTLGIDKDVTYTLSKWDPNNKDKYVGEEALWETSQVLLREILEDTGLNFTEDEGGAAFYGPKLDIDFRNVHGKKDTIITIQLDFSLAKMFGMTYVDKDKEKKTPVCIHRTSVGCYERTLAMLIEKYAGAMPTWLSLTQVALLPISDKYADYAQSVVDKLKSNGVRVHADFRSEKLGYKIRAARLERTPYILIVGEQEAKDGTVSVRSRAKGEEGNFAVGDIIKRIREDIDTKSLESVSGEVEFFENE